VVCDYHGNIVSDKEGNAILSRHQTEEGNYMMFFRDTKTNKKMCVDAATVPCQCHHDIPTAFGRLINHSAKNPNLINVVRYVNGRVCVLFLAKTKIEPNTELGEGRMEKKKLYL